MQGFVSGFEKVAAINLWKGRIRSGIHPSVLKPAALPPKTEVRKAVAALEPSARAKQIRSQVTPGFLWRQALREKK